MILRADGTLDGKLIPHQKFGPHKPGRKRKLRWNWTECYIPIPALSAMQRFKVWRLPATKRMKEHYVTSGLPKNGFLRNNERFGFGCTWAEAFRYLGNVVKVLEVERELMRSKPHGTS